MDSDGAATLDGALLEDSKAQELLALTSVLNSLIIDFLGDKKDPRDKTGLVKLTILCYCKKLILEEMIDCSHICHICLRQGEDRLPSK